MQNGVDVAREVMHMALLTRKMRSDEKSSPEGQAALRSEMKKICETYEALDAPVERSTAAARYPEATISNFALLSFMKFAETANPKHKGRAVVLGDRIRSISSQMAPQEESGAWEDMATSLAALEEGRLVDAFALINKFRVQSADVEAAYLQESWPDEVPPHFLSIPREYWSYLPEHLNPERLGVRDPVFRMRRMIYGHPESGHVSVHRMGEFLRGKGWESVGNGALFARGRCLLCMYVAT